MVVLILMSLPQLLTRRSFWVGILRTALPPRLSNPSHGQGDMLVVTEPGEPPAKSLVVALSGDRVLARRFEIAENFSDVAVLTAQAINPRQIAPPVIAHKATFTLHKIIGVLYERRRGVHPRRPRWKSLNALERACWQVSQQRP